MYVYYLYYPLMRCADSAKRTTKFLRIFSVTAQSWCVQGGIISKCIPHSLQSANSSTKDLLYYIRETKQPAVPSVVESLIQIIIKILDIKTLLY